MAGVKKLRPVSHPPVYGVFVDNGHAFAVVPNK